MFVETKWKRLTLPEIVQWGGGGGGCRGMGWFGRIWEKEKWANDGGGGKCKGWHKIFLFFRSPAVDISTIYSFYSSFGSILHKVVRI